MAILSGHRSRCVARFGAGDRFFSRKVYHELRGPIGEVAVSPHERRLRGTFQEVVSWVDCNLKCSYLCADGGEGLSVLQLYPLQCVSRVRLVLQLNPLRGSLCSLRKVYVLMDVPADSIARLNAPVCTAGIACAESRYMGLFHLQSDSICSFFCITTSPGFTTISSGAFSRSQVHQTVPLAASGSLVDTAMCRIGVLNSIVSLDLPKKVMSKIRKKRQPVR